MRESRHPSDRVWDDEVFAESRDVTVTHSDMREIETRERGGVHRMRL